MFEFLAPLAIRYPVAELKKKNPTLFEGEGIFV